MVDKALIAQTFADIQDDICMNLESLDGVAKFQEDNWERPGGGGGRTRIIQHGDLIEKGGVNFSKVYGKLPEVIAKEFKADNAEFFATGTSIVLHSVNPFVPIIHMNIRYFEMSNGTYWFGGGIDMTPHFVDLEQASIFHHKLKKVCDKHHSSFYDSYKKWADDYFFIKHRNETRGIGGIFFDKLSDQLPKDALFNFVSDVGRTFVDCYSEPAEVGRNKPYTDADKRWQLIRRGRYVEFNLVYDRGTKFGLETSGRIESILMSLPENASWLYNYQAEPNTEEFKTLEYLKKGIDWVNLK